MSHPCLPVVQLGLELLSFDSFSRFGASEAVFESLLPQLCFSEPSVCAAAAAVGSAYNMQASHTAASPGDEAFAASQYQFAFNATRRDLLLQPCGPIPLILICFMLSIAEIFLQKRRNALFHPAGASKLLQYQRNTISAFSPARSDILDGDADPPEDRIDALFRSDEFESTAAI
jgi:hypothetical protein